MPEPNTIGREAVLEKRSVRNAICYHCGSLCTTRKIIADEKLFCCAGCKLVYEILNKKGLCDYYTFQSHPALTQIKPLRSDKYLYLDNEQIASKLYKFTDGVSAMVTFYIPGIHCSSCMWLMEHLNRINPGISESRLNFSSKEITISFRKTEISLREVVELMTTIGYEPCISLNDDTNNKKDDDLNKAALYKLGVAGFCFGNIMMLSFPEYLAGGTPIDHRYIMLFRGLILLLSIPVFFYSGSDFFVSAWKGLKQRFLNIDAPISLALIITFTRSIYEISTNTGSGFLDSMSGIVFFMLVGRGVQQRAYKSISFHRDYKAYFPLAVNVVTDDGIMSKSIGDLKANDVVQIHYDEIIPADGLVLQGTAAIDYSFVTGESAPVTVLKDVPLYAGGKQLGGQFLMKVTRSVATSYLTTLWNHYAFSKNKGKQNDANSLIHKLSRYFTYVLFALVAIAALYWSYYDPAKILPSVSSMLIVACPCALLLSSSYTNGNLLRILSINGLFLRDATVIEQLGKINHMVFDKTGTLTHGTNQTDYQGQELSDEEKDILFAAVSPSKHPYSRIIASYLRNRKEVALTSWKETTGRGIEAHLGKTSILIGSRDHVNAFGDVLKNVEGTVYACINEKVGVFNIKTSIRSSVPKVLKLLTSRFSISLLSGDNEVERDRFRDLFGSDKNMSFGQKPIDKLLHIEKLQQEGNRVLMIGDGLNDAGALQQSNVGITIADDINNFTPSCDAILDAKKFSQLPAIIKLSSAAQYIMATSFAVSILYNLIGLYIAVRGEMNPMIAAILMPVSTISIVLITTGLGSVIALFLGLSIRDKSDFANSDDLNHLLP